MKERPILFSGPMVRALLAGTKTQTRRGVKPQFAADAIPVEMPATDPAGGWVVPGHSGVWWCDAAANPDDVRRCPYGQPGDRLWVRESWQFYDWTEDGLPCVRFAADNATTWPRSVPQEQAARLEDIWAGLSSPENYDIDNRARDHRWRPSIHMPRWASRITLEITSVRVERLQDIDISAAQAEGVSDTGSLILDSAGNEQGGPIAEYAVLWEQINGPGSWAANPWVWVLEFCRINSKEIEHAAE